MENKNNNYNSGIGFTGLLQLMFIGMKLLNVIKWSWLWVLAPTWITAGIVVAIIVCVGVWYFIKK